MKISEVSGDRIDNKAKLGVIKQEEDIIKQEEEEAKLLEERDAKAKAKEAEEAAAARALEEMATPTKEVEEVVLDAAQPITPFIVDSAPEIQVKPEELLVDKAKVIEEEKGGSTSVCN